MNKRQKKKRYKKLYGYNPPKKYKDSDALVTVNNLERVATAMRDLSGRIQYAVGVISEGLGRALMEAGQAMQENALEQRGEQNEQSNFNGTVDKESGNQDFTGRDAGGQIYAGRE